MKQIESQFNELRLSGMSRSWQTLVESQGLHELSLTEGLKILLQAEKEEREARRFERLRKNARFRYQASLEEISYDASRGLNKSLIMELATCNYIEKGESILITGDAVRASLLPP